MKLKLPEEIYLVLKKNETELAKDLLLKAAIQYYTLNQLSLARAANMCGLSRLEFIDMLQSLNIPVFNDSINEVNEIHIESENILERTAFQ